MVTEKGNGVPVKNRWLIDPDWYEKNNRSFFDIAHRSLCTKCVEKLDKKKKKATHSDILAAIRDCCARSPEYITVKMPIAESIFRVLLASGQPVELEEIGRQISERRGGDSYAGNPDLIIRLLENDHSYGFKKANK